MTEAEFLEYEFGLATGWLGWPPEFAWRSTVPEIDVAIAAKVEFIQMTTPGMKKPKEKQRQSGMAQFIASIVKREGTKVYGD